MLERLSSVGVGCRRRGSGRCSWRRRLEAETHIVVVVVAASSLAAPEHSVHGSVSLRLLSLEPLPLFLALRTLLLRFIPELGRFFCLLALCSLLGKRVVALPQTSGFSILARSLLNLLVLPLLLLPSREFECLPRLLLRLLFRFPLLDRRLLQPPHVRVIGNDFLGVGVFVHRKEALPFPLRRRGRLGTCRRRRQLGTCRLLLLLLESTTAAAAAARRRG